MTRRIYRVSGRVQGVGFRRFVQRVGTELGLRGSARNLDDGRVEVEAAGPEDQLATLELRLWHGPRFANVTKVEKIEISDEISDLTGFWVVD